MIFGVRREWTLKTGKEHTRLKKILELIPDDIQLILDVGCGRGDISKIISEHKKCEVVGVDIRFSPETIKLLMPVQCDLEVGFPFKDNALPCIFAGEVIEHIYDTDFFVKECYRILKPGGHLILTTPNLVSLENRARILFGQKPPIIKTRVKSRGSRVHIRYFTFKELRELLRDHNFIIERYFTGGVKFLPEGDSEIYRLKKISDVLGRVFPNLGHDLIVKAKKEFSF